MKKFLQICILVMCSPAVMASEVCHPDVDMSRPQYGIGYGSLMEDASRTRTAPNTGEALPALVQGLNDRSSRRATLLVLAPLFWV